MLFARLPGDILRGSFAWVRGAAVRDILKGGIPAERKDTRVLRRVRV